MEEKWLKYYKEMFNLFKSGMFIKLWGDDHDEYGEEYEKVYSFELIDMANDFANFMYMFNKYNLRYDPRSVAHQLIYLFETLGDCDYPGNALSVAKLIIDTIEKEITVNNVIHPNKSKR